MVDNGLREEKLTPVQSFTIGISSGAVSSLVNHPFQVLRARFQNHHALKINHPSIKPPPIFTSDFRVLFRGFPATLLSMWSLTITQALAKNSCSSIENDKIKEAQLLATFLAGFVSAFITTPLEGSIIRQSKTAISGRLIAKRNFFEESRQFYREHGLRRLYLGATAIGIRTALVGSGFSFWIPAFAMRLEKIGSSDRLNMLVSGVLVGTTFALLSQPAEAIRIEQQFSANEKSQLSIYQATKTLIKQNGFFGLFKGASYRVPRTAPGIFINSIVSVELEKHFYQQNKTR